jgi:predicted N-acetyltransferase YhbS
LLVLRIARLAVDQRATGSGIGLSLLHAVFVVAHRMASHVGCAGVLVDAKPDAVTFFERFGFIPLQGGWGHLANVQSLR